MVSVDLQRLLVGHEMTLELLDSRHYSQKFFFDGTVPFLVDVKFAGVVGHWLENAIHVLEKHSS